MGERRVSLGESGRFIWGKSEFPLRKVKEAEKDGKQAISGAMEDSENALHLFYCHTDFTDFTDFLSHRKTAFELCSLANERTQEIAETTKWIALQKVVNQTFTRDFEYETQK